MLVAIVVVCSLAARVATARMDRMRTGSWDCRQSVVEDRQSQSTVGVGVDSPSALAHLAFRPLGAAPANGWRAALGPQQSGFTSASQQTDRTESQQAGEDVWIVDGTDGRGSLILHLSIVVSMECEPSGALRQPSRREREHREHRGQQAEQRTVADTARQRDSQDRTGGSRELLPAR